MTILEELKAVVRETGKGAETSTKSCNEE